MKNSLFQALLLLGIGMANSILVELPDLGVLMGRVQHTVKGKPFYNFRNIPFAENTGGENRFKPPVALEREIGTMSEPYDATKSGPLCPQMGLEQSMIDEYYNERTDVLLKKIFKDYGIDWIIDIDWVFRLLEGLLDVKIAGRTVADVLRDLVDLDLSTSEDCLHVSVSTPQLPSNQTDLLPVMFFIYGGNYIAGTQMKMNYDRLGDANDVVLVAVNYRVGPLGFLCLDSEEAAGNMGLLDQIMGLEWVQKYITHFGGDPSRVTIFGESAGAASVSFLSISKEADGLFNQVIGESASALVPWAFDADISSREKAARRFAGRVGCDVGTNEDMVACLRKLPQVDLAKGELDMTMEEFNNAEAGFGIHVACGQTKGDRKVFSAGQTPEDIVKNKDYTPKPSFYGANSDEGLLPFSEIDVNTFTEAQKKNESFLIFESVQMLLESFSGMPNVSQAMALKYRDTYFKKEELGNYEDMAMGFVDILGALGLKDPTYRFIEENSKVAPSYFYSFEKRSRKSMYRVFNQMGNPNLLSPSWYKGKGYAAHADELFYLFKVDVPIAFCDPKEFFRGLALAFSRCTVTSPFAKTECVTDPNHFFKKNFGDCLDNHLLEDEQAVSDAITKAFTNFAVYGSPTPGGYGLPSLAPFDESNPSYIVFDTKTRVERQTYRNTYHHRREKKTPLAWLLG